MRTWPMLSAAGALATFAGAAAAQTVTYENTVKKVVGDRRLGCHGAGAPTLAEFDKHKEGWKKKMKGPRIDDYKNLVILVNGSDAGALMRRLKRRKELSEGELRSITAPEE